MNFNLTVIHNYVLDSILHVQEGDMFSALLFSDQGLIHLGGLDRVGDSSSGYLMMDKSTNTLDLSWINKSGGASASNIGWFVAKQ